MMVACAGRSRAVNFGEVLTRRAKGARRRSLAAYQALRGRIPPRVQPGFPVHPAIRVTPDPLVRADSRDGLNQLCDISDWRLGPMLRALAELHEDVRIHRKAWEFGKLLGGLQQLGCIHPGATGISVGAGTERPLFWLADRIQRIVATDLYETEIGKWGWGSEFLREKSCYWHWPYRREALDVRNMPGTQLDFPDGSFDFAYSLSSIEHFGGHEAARNSVREMARVTKPGGIVCVVTELLLSRNPTPERFTYEELRHFLLQGNGLALVEPEIDLRISESLLAYPKDMWREADDVSPSIVIKEDAYPDTAWTSIILFFCRLGGRVPTG